jgi:PEP-CTERM motif-containing protein/CHRD domain-containing protein
MAGEAYLNIHTTNFPGGEIRGYLTVAAVPEPETFALLLVGLGAVGWAVRRRGQLRGDSA